VFKLLLAAAVVSVAGPNDAPHFKRHDVKIKAISDYSSSHLQITGLNLVPFLLLHPSGSYWRMLQAYRYSHEQLLQQWHKQDIRDDSVQLGIS
jgi:hypothetical protein